MGLRTLLKIATVASAIFPATAIAGWTGPEEVLRLYWGTAAAEVQVVVGDTLAYDQVPGLAMVDEQFAYVFDQQEIAVQKVFRLNDGALQRSMSGAVAMACSDYLGNGRIACIQGHGRQQLYITDVASGVPIWSVALGPTAGCPAVGAVGVATTHLWSCPYLYDTTGTLIRETTERPLELGASRLVKNKPLPPWTWEVEFPDRIYLYEAQERLIGFLPRRINPDVFVNGLGERFETAGQVGETPEGKPKFRLVERGERPPVPKDTHECVDDPADVTTGETCTRRTSYGQSFVIGPDGSVYSYKAVYPGNPDAGYYILKWTWVP